MQVLSLASVSVKISNANYGNVNLGGNRYIELAGGGKLVDSISYSFTNDMFSVSSTADGGAYVSHNASRAGEISISCNQTSPHVPMLRNFFKWCQANPELAESTLIITDRTGNIACSCTGVFPTKLPEVTVSGTAGSQSFAFGAADIEAQEGNA